MVGGSSQLDPYDYKRAFIQYDGQPVPQDLYHRGCHREQTGGSAARPTALRPRW